MNELRGEKVDIVEFRADTKQFIAEALSPAKVRQVILNDETKEATVIVPDHQLSLAIGKEGQNARLAARLSGYRIDIRPETPAADAVPIAPEAVVSPGVEGGEPPAAGVPADGGSASGS